MDGEAKDYRLDVRFHWDTTGSESKGRTIRNSCSLS